MNEIDLFGSRIPSVPAATPDERDKARRVLERAIEAEERRLNRSSSLHLRGRPALRKALVAAAALMVVAVVAGVVVGVGPLRSPLGPDPAAAAALNRAADASASYATVFSSGPVLDTDEYVHAVSEGVALHTYPHEGDWYSALVPYRRETWTATDGSGRLIRTDGQPQFLSEEDRSMWDAAGRPAIAGTEDQLIGPGGLRTEDLSLLPSDPDELRRLLIDELTGSSKPLEAAMFDRIRNLLAETHLQTGQRVALYQVAATIDGITYIGDVTDRAGRPGVAVALTYRHSEIERRNVMIFDPQSGALLGTESILLSASPEIRAPLPVTVGHETFYPAELVDHIPND